MKKNISISQKIIFGFAGILLLLLALTIVGILRVSQIRKDLEQINSINAVKQRYAINFRGSVHDRAIKVRDILIIDDKSTLDTLLSEIVTLKTFYTESATKLDEMQKTDGMFDKHDSELLAEIKRVQSLVDPQIDQIINWQKTGQIEQALNLLLSQTRLNFQDWLDKINLFIDYQEDKNETLTIATTNIANGFATLMLVSTGIAVLISIILSSWIIRAVSPLKHVGNALKDIAQGEGNLTSKIDIKTNDEIGSVAGNFNTFVETLNKIISTVKSSVDGLAHAGQGLTESMEATQHALTKINANIAQVQEEMGTQNTEISDVSSTIAQISANISELNTMIETQSDSLNNSSSAVEQMIANVQSVTNTVNKSLSQFDNLSTVSEEGFQRIKEVQEKVEEISEKSQGMSEANQVINQIASQTNLLAMNAAIEAAHAGEAGKGFAVVADEIRKLAENSGLQSKKISITLKGLVTSISEVVGSSKEAGVSFESVKTAVNNVVTLQTEIQAAMDAQTIGNSQVGESFNTIRDLTHKVRTSASEMMTGSQRISKMADNLVHITTGIRNSMETMSESSEEIKSAVAEVGILANDTDKGIKIVKQEINRFITN